MKPELIHVRIFDTWWWECPICGDLLAPHKMYRVLQSKGAASRHLGRHDPSFVNHGRNVIDITWRDINEN